MYLPDLHLPLLPALAQRLLRDHFDSIETHDLPAFTSAGFRVPTAIQMTLVLIQTIPRLEASPEGAECWVLVFQVILKD